MSLTFWITTICFVIVAMGMIMIILVQRPQGGGLAGAFGGAGGGGTDTVFGGRVGDALTVATVCAFVIFLGLAIALNLMDDKPVAGASAVDGTTIQVPSSEDVTPPATDDGGGSP